MGRKIILAATNLLHEIYFYSHMHTHTCMHNTHSTKNFFADFFYGATILFIPQQLVPKYYAHYNCYKRYLRV